MKIGYVRVSSISQNKERQQEGIVLTKLNGKYKGRKTIPFPEN